MNLLWFNFKAFWNLKRVRVTFLPLLLLYPTFIAIYFYYFSRETYGLQEVKLRKNKKIPFFLFLPHIFLIKQQWQKAEILQQIISISICPLLFKSRVWPGVLDWNNLRYSTPYCYRTSEYFDVLLLLFTQIEKSEYMFVLWQK